MTCRDGCVCGDTGCDVVEIGAQTVDVKKAYIVGFIHGELSGRHPSPLDADTMFGRAEAEYKKWAEVR